MELFIFVFNTLASTTGFIISILALGLFLYLRGEKRRAALFILYSSALMLVVYGLKEFFKDSRPEGTLVDISGYGFPSGHATGAMYLALIVCIFASRLPFVQRYGIYLAVTLFAVTVGVSRVYLYAHTPIQVYAGFGVGAVWGLGLFAYRRNI
jgi:undecaprenyl-diphosphatase